MVVPGIGRNRFSVPSATEQGATTIFALEELRIETNDFIIPLQQVGGRHDLYRFNIELGGIDLAVHAEVNADQWRRRMDHINARSLELLNKMDANGLSVSGEYRLVTSVPSGRASSNLTRRSPTSGSPCLFT